MTDAFVDRPYRDERVAMRPSRFLNAALVAFIGVAGGATFQSVSAVFGAFDACVAAFVCVALLGFAARGWVRRQPAAIRAHAGSLTAWDRAGKARHWQIVGCAQIGGWLLALTLSAGHGRPRTLVIAADSIDRDPFRQLSVSARRAARAYL